jgi:hypothetical protein
MGTPPCANVNCVYRLNGIPLDKAFGVECGLGRFGL